MNKSENEKREKCCKSKQVYSVEDFFDIMTDKYYFLNERKIDSMIIEMEEILEKEFPNHKLRNFDLDDIDYIVENHINVVLVAISGFRDDNLNNFVTEARWFEIP